MAAHLETAATGLAARLERTVAAPVGLAMAAARRPDGCHGLDRRSGGGCVGYARRYLLAGIRRHQCGAVRCVAPGDHVRRDDRSDLRLAAPRRSAAMGLAA